MTNSLTRAFFTATLVSLMACSGAKKLSQTSAPKYTPVSRELYSTIARMDSAMFDAFNKRDYNKLESYISEDLEFYHDMGGVTNYQQNMDAFKRVFQSERLLRRELVKESLEVYPINNYGAVETGTHKFYATEKGKAEELSSEAKFVQIWRNSNGTWKATRIVSYGHIEHLK